MLKPFLDSYIFITLSFSSGWRRAHISDYTVQNNLYLTDQDPGAKLETLRIEWCNWKEKFSEGLMSEVK